MNPHSHSGRAEAQRGASAVAPLERVGMIGNPICEFHQGQRSMAAQKGRIHDRSRQVCRNKEEALAERGPSIHDGG